VQLHRNLDRQRSTACESRALAPSFGSFLATVLRQPTVHARERFEKGRQSVRADRLKPRPKSIFCESPLLVAEHDVQVIWRIPVVPAATCDSVFRDLFVMVDEIVFHP